MEKHINIRESSKVELLNFLSKNKNFYTGHLGIIYLSRILGIDYREGKEEYFNFVSVCGENIKYDLELDNIKNTKKDELTGYPKTSLYLYSREISSIRK